MAPHGDFRWVVAAGSLSVALAAFAMTDGGTRDAGRSDLRRSGHRSREITVESPEPYHEVDVYQPQCAVRYWPPRDLGCVCGGAAHCTCSYRVVRGGADSCLVHIGIWHEELSVTEFADGGQSIGIACSAPPSETVLSLGEQMSACGIPVTCVPLNR
jgi:hypothetical protein